MNIEQVRELLRERCGEAGGQRAFARLSGIDVSYVNHVLNGKKTPGEQVLDHLGLRAVVTTTYEVVESGPQRV